MGQTTRGRRLTRLISAGALFVAILAAAMDSTEARQEITVDSFTITDRRNDQLHPRIDGRHVVWQDYRDIGAYDGDRGNADIWAMNLDSWDEFLVQANRTSSSPDVSGNVFVFADSRHGDLDIRAYNVKKDQSFWVARQSGSDQDRPAIDGNLVVWQDNRDGRWSIRARDLDRDEEFWVVRREGNQTNPRVSGRRVVWEDDRNGCCDIYVKDLDSGDTTRLTDDNDAREPDIDGDWVVYRRGDGHRAGIWAHNIQTDERFRLNASGDDTRARPTVSGRLAAWADRRNGDDWNIMGYDLDGRQEFVIARSDSDQQEPAVSGNRVVWTDRRSQRGLDIRGASLGLPAIEARQTAEPTATPVDVPAPPIGGAPDQGSCFFQLGFKLLRDQVPAVVGDCVENEWHNADNGDGLQRTTGGLMVWRKADNWTAFTNGSTTWLNGPCGLQTRPNEGPFYAWEGRIGSPCI